MRASLFAAIVLAFSSVALAFPSQLVQRGGPSSQISHTCDISKVTVPLDSGMGSTLPPPSAGLYLAHVAIGRGTQNYTCDLSNSTAIPKAVGAKATLFNATCLSASPQNLVASIPGFALKTIIPTSSDSASVIAQLTSGHHYFTNLTTPFFDFQSDVPHNYGKVYSAKLAAIPAPKNAPAGPNGRGSVPWLKLAGFEGDYKEVYRVDTAGGVAPESCKGQQANFEIEYAAAYYFYAGS